MQRLARFSPRSALLSALVAALVTPTPAARGQSADAPADPRPGQSLIHPGTLLGWDHGPQPIEGWTTAGGHLAAAAGATPLVSGWTVGAFELRVTWSGDADGAALDLLLPNTPRGERLSIRLSGGADCGRVTAGQRLLATGASPGGEASAKSRTALVRRANGHLEVSVDGRMHSRVELDPNRRFGLGLAIAAGSVTVEDLRLSEPAGGSLFNGKDLDGWWTPGNKEAWDVRDGHIMLVGRNGNYLRSEREFGNFTLSLEYLADRGCNSGIGIRTPRNAWPSGDGMELQILDRPGIDKHASMAIYGNVEPFARADKSQQWNHVVVKADGYMITAWVNGTLVQHVNTIRTPELKHRNLSGWIGFQDHGRPIRFRNIHVLEAPDGLGMDAWYAQRAEHAAALLLDRLMNPERLAQPDGLVTRRAVLVADGDEETTLAELAGPAALVRASDISGSGRLAFYRDGQSQPILETTVDRLHEALPRVTEDTQPVLTCLPFTKSLKIVARQSKGLRLPIEYVVLPENAVAPAPALGAGRGVDFPRGLLAAIEYRREQHSWGTHREHDPVPRHGGEQRTINPGARVELARADGAGMVQWLKLRANKQVLADNDLWLEITVDGQPQPSVAAPARLLMPGHAAGGNYQNFLFVDRGGVTSRLPIPFSSGVSVAAVNRGAQPIAGVGVQISVTGESPGDRMRLFGVYLPAGSSQPLEVAGRGRWVGLVVEQPAGDAARPLLASVAIDGQDDPFYSGITAAALIGSAEPEFRRATSGRAGGLAWRHLQLAPVEFERSLRLAPAAENYPPRLVLFYAAP